MNRSLRCVALPALLAFGGLLAPAYATVPTPTVTCWGYGSVLVTVIHPVTKERLVNLPVTVKPDRKGMLVTSDPTANRYWVLWTDKYGRADFWGIPEGFYVTYVNYNNVMSEMVKFEVVSGSKPPTVSLYFNPDIDRK